MPNPLTPEQIADTKDAWDGVGCEVISAAVIQDLIATIEQAWAERDHWKANHDDQVRRKQHAHSVIRRLLNNWTLDATPRWTPKQADAITQAQDTTQPKDSP